MRRVLEHWIEESPSGADTPVTSLEDMLLSLRDIYENGDPLRRVALRQQKGRPEPPPEGIVSSDEEDPKAL